MKKETGTFRGGAWDRFAEENQEKDKLSQRLLAYAAAAGAAGVGVLAAAAPARADIVFTPANITFSDSNLAIDITHGTLNDFLFTGFSSTNMSLNVDGYHGDGILRGPSGYAAALGRGAKIGASAGKFFEELEMAGISYRGSTLTGSWADVRNRYLGLSIDVNGQIHYGWAELSVRKPGSRRAIVATLEGYAYDTVANQTIRAGQVGPNTLISTTPEPGTLGLLALGSLGVGFWRRKKSLVRQS